MLCVYVCLFVCFVCLFGFLLYVVAYDVGRFLRITVINNCMFFLESKALAFANRITLASEAMDEAELVKAIAELEEMAKTAPKGTDKIDGQQPIASESEPGTVPVSDDATTTDDEKQKAAVTSQQMSVMTLQQVASEMKRAQRELDIILARKGKTIQ